MYTYHRYMNGMVSGPSMGADMKVAFNISNIVYCSID
jgi:hypothetical protein